ncbi:MAG: hypothetical protein ACIAS6_08965 [Phycisphaerales bacterium JB060]
MDWIFTILAWSLLVLGLVLLAWAILWDRSRGRRRCPKCWYGMDGVPQAESGGWMCPECGRAIARERRLLRTRRRWGFVVFAIVLLAASYASHMGPAVRSRGWWAAAPDLLLIALLPHADAFDRPATSGGMDNAVRDEVAVRSRATPYGPKGSSTNPTWVDGKLWPWERWLLRGQAMKMLADAEDDFEVQRAVWYGVLASDRLDAGLPSEYVASAIVARSLLAYERCEQYMDYGIHVNLPGIGPHPYELFVTGMQEPGFFRYEQRDRHPHAHSRWMRKVVWRGHDGVLKDWWSVTEQRGIEQPARLGLALASVHHDVSGALFPAEHWGSPLTRSDVSEFVGESELLGVRVYELRGESRHGGIDMLWIDAETFLVRRARNTFGDTWFVPVAGREARAILDKSWWSFDPAEQDNTPLERFEEKLQTFLEQIEMPTEDQQREARMRLNQRIRNRSGGTP